MKAQWASTSLCFSMEVSSRELAYLENFLVMLALLESWLVWKNYFQVVSSFMVVVVGSLKGFCVKIKN
jgi:hypothetical protein